MLINYYYYDCFYSTKCVCTCVCLCLCVCAPAISIFIHHSDVGNAGDDMQHKAISSWSNARLLPSIKIPYLRGKRDPGSLLSASVVMRNPSVHCIHNTAGLIKLRDKTLARLHQWRCDQSFVFFCGIFWAIATYINIINTLQLLIVTWHFASTETSVATASQYRVGEKASELIVETTVRSSSNHVKASESVRICPNVCGQHPYFELLVRLI